MLGPVPEQCIQNAQKSIWQHQNTGKDQTGQRLKHTTAETLEEKDNSLLTQPELHARQERMLGMLLAGPYTAT